ncbi:hypothetical protein ABUW04_05120 [Streptacidiphilus sp. N1-10]|uniref:Uncharacterized protein n=1 Tax=Streptacidiphilus jeojiensis TaxID=3229225 RepID=A0ABV6XH91_9ACTN
MMLIYGTVQGLEQAERFAVERFGLSGRLPRCPRARWEDRRLPIHQGPQLARFLAGELEAIDFDGHVVNVDEEPQDHCERLRYVDLYRNDDGAAVCVGIGGDVPLVPGTRVVARWITVEERYRQFIEVWADLNEFENPIVTREQLMPPMYLKQQRRVLGTIFIESVDMPWWRGCFRPSTAFDSVRPLFDAWTLSVEDGREELAVSALAALDDLGLTLEPIDGSKTLTDFLLHIEGSNVRLRF